MVEYTEKEELYLHLLRQLRFFGELYTRGVLGEHISDEESEAIELIKWRMLLLQQEADSE